MSKGRTHIILTAVILAALLCLPVQARALDVERRVLDNGLTVLHVQRDNIPVVVATLLVRAGQIDEPASRDGLASLTASLLTEGTSTRTSTQVSEEVEFIGASLSASAEEDYATISLSVLKRHMDKGFELFSDILLNPVFAEEEIARKKEQIIASLKQRQEDPGYVAGESFAKAVFGSHPYGRALEGTPESLENITRKDIFEFYKTHYVPGGAVLALVGDMSAHEVDEIIQRYLSEWMGEPPPRPDLPEIPEPEPRTVTIDRNLTQANIRLGHVGVRRDNPDYYALSVMNYILGGGGFSSRLMDSVRDQMGLAYSIYSVFLPHRETGMFYTAVQTKNESADTVIEEILRQMRRIAAEPVSEQELADAKSYLVGSFPRRLETLGRIARFLVAVEFYGLGMDYPERYRDYIESVTREDIQRVAKKYLHQDKFTLVVVGDIEAAALKDGY